MQLTDTDLKNRLDPPSDDWRSLPGLRDSAVLLPLVRRDGLDRIVFNLRRPDLPTHAGQVCFPGGSREGDEDPATCAIRETVEEMGIEATDVTVLGRLPDKISVASHRVAAFAARLDPERPYRPLEREVAEVFEVPLRRLLERERWEWRAATHPRSPVHAIPYFESGVHVVWGLTGIILSDFLRTAVGFETRG